MFAGGVEVMPTDDNRWEDDKADMTEPEVEPESDKKPSEVSAESLAELDRKALQVELSKLRRLRVIEDVPEDQCDGDSKPVDLTSVCDWRFREETWRRRCRIVAREFHYQADTRAPTFSQTSTTLSSSFQLETVRCGY